jgi:hypothetical protein
MRSCLGIGGHRPPLQFCAQGAQVTRKMCRVKVAVPGRILTKLIQFAFYF